jgi:hypothetical protein
MAFTRILNLAHSRARVLVRASTPAFAAVGAIRPGEPLKCSVAGSCTSIVRVIPSPENQVKYPHFTTV